MQNNYSFLRDVIGDYLVNLADQNEKIVVVSADMVSTCRLKKFEEKYPNRIFNVGIAEQNMASFAAGLAHEGFIPYIFTMAPFMSMRACEQIRTDIAYSNLKVRMIAPYSGCSGGISGPTHWGMEDYEIMSSIPNIRIFEPSDAFAAKEIMRQTIDYNGPVYIRCSIEPSMNIYDSKNNFDINKSNILVEGNDGYYVCSGITVGYALEASKIIKKKHNKAIGVVDMFSNYGIDKKVIEKCADTKVILVAQDHNIIGGLGQLVGTFIARNNIDTKFDILGIPNKFEIMGHAQYIYHKFGYDVEGLVENMMRLINE